MRILQILGLPPPTMTFEHERAEEDSVAKNPAAFQRPLLITPCLGGLILLIWSHAFGGIMAALAWTALALVLAKASFKLVRRRFQRVLPALTEIESFELTCSVLAPLWIAEPLRMVLASGFLIAGKSDPMTVFRVSRPEQWLGELITGVAIILVVKRIHSAFNAGNVASRNSRIVTTTLIILALFCATYALTAVAALFAVASTMTFSFM